MSVHKLTPAQILGAERIAAARCFYLADLPGFGKTAQLVHAADMAGATRGTVICPPILRDNIAREFAMWSVWQPPVHVIRTGKDELPADGFIAISYQLAADERMAKRLAKRGGDFLACDEAHALKSPGASRTRAVLRANGIASSHNRMLWMSGTPAPNNSSELYTFCKAAGLWSGSHSAFTSEFCVTVDTPYGPKILGNRNADRLKSMLAPVMLRREINSGLPPLTSSVFPVTGDEASITAELPPDVADRIAHAVETGDYQFLTTPAISSVRRMAGLAKAGGVAQLAVHELDSGGAPLLIFAQHTAVIDTISAALAKASARLAVLDGRTPPRRRQEIIDAFQAGKIDALVCQIQAASEGLTLTRAARVILAEPSWTPKDNEQAIARAWRRGQSRSVHVWVATLANSIDDRIIRTLERKKSMLGEIFGS